MVNSSRAAALALLTAVAGCVSPLPETSPADPAAAGIVVSLEPLSAQANSGGFVSFRASVTGTADQGVVWSIQEGPSGGSVDANGGYTAPASTGSYHVVAASHADPTRVQIATVSVLAGPVVVSLVPSSATVDACRSVTFDATVSGVSNQGVVWSVTEGEAGGTITQGGVYTAPTTAGTYHVAASSLADPAQVAEATVVVGLEKVISLAVNPGSALVASSGSLAFSAVMTTSCGTFAVH